MANLLEERLRSNSNAFEGLLSLIPAKYYYDDKTQEQWKAKKKSKQQSKEDKQKKLDPEQQGENSLSTLEVMKEREKDAKPVVLPGEKLKKMREQEKKEDDEADDEEEASGEIDGSEDIDVVFDDEGNEIFSKDNESEEEEDDDDEEEDDDDEEEEEKDSKQPSAVGKKSQGKDKGESVSEENNESPKSQNNKRNLEALRSKLQAKIQDMKEKRRAPGSKAKGAPSSRETIIAERKRKLDLKKQKKESQKQQNNKNGDESESDEDDSDIETQHPTKKAKLDIDPNDIMFQNIEFDDGNRVASNLQNLRKTKKKGPAKNDIRAHLKLLEQKKAKLQAKEETDQIDAKEKEKWQRATLQAEGVKLKDDEKLLRKALKRKEAKKRRSEQEWRDRKLAVKTSKAEKQKRREENLQIRKQNKGMKRSKQQKMKSAYKGNSTTVKRAGFEGRLKSGKKK